MLELGSVTGCFQKDCMRLGAGSRTRWTAALACLLPVWWEQNAWQPHSIRPSEILHVSETTRLVWMTLQLCKCNRCGNHQRWKGTWLLQPSADAIYVSIPNTLTTVEAYAARDGPNLSELAKCSDGNWQSLWRTRYDNRSCILPVLKEIQGKGMYFIFIYSMLRGKQANIAAHNLAKFASLHSTGWDVRGRTKSLIVFSLPLYSAWL